MTPNDPTRVALVGAGRVGTAVALLLKQAGFAVVGVSSRSETSQAEAAARLGCEVFDFRSALPDADVVLVGVGDAGLEEVARVLAPRIAAGTYVCHFSGSIGARPFEVMARAGAKVCALHPVQACPDVDTAVRRLPGSAWGVTCDTDDLAWAEALVSGRLNGRPVRVREEDRPVWHAAAVIVSNGIAALMSIGESMMTSIDVDTPKRILSPLALGTVRNARDGGGGGRTLTGPVVRGESFIIERHLDALRPSDLAPAYAQVVRMIVGAARETGRIDPAVADEMLDRVDSP